MKILCEANRSAMSVLRTVTQSGTDMRMLHYCVESAVEDGVLLYNLLTKELVLLTEEEYANRLSNEELHKHWFVVPRDCNDKEYAELVKWVLQTKQPKKDAITGYTIFTTTDCNARCFYCYELGGARIPMSEETAYKVVRFIKDHCGGKAVKLSWFGGEPLYNAKVIDIITDGLHEAGVEYSSSIVSNGYLFDGEMVRKAVEKWNLKKVQISLDGTESIYNRSKAYIYRDGSAYHVVLGNIGRLLEAGIKVSIRLNTDLHNGEDLMLLVDELAERFGMYKNLYVYAHLLFEGDKAMAEQHSDEEWAVRGEVLNRLNQRIAGYDFGLKNRIEKNVRLNYCMADNDGCVTVLPTGDIGVCEHYIDREFIGHVDGDDLDQAVIASWKERMTEIPECAECFYFPACTNLKKCPTSGKCFPLQRQERYDKTCSEMLNEYRHWKLQN